MGSAQSLLGRSGAAVSALSSDSAKARASWRARASLASANSGVSSKAAEAIEQAFICMRSSEKIEIGPASGAPAKVASRESLREQERERPETETVASH